MELPDVAPSLPAENRVADERTSLVDMVDFYRIVLIRKSWGLTPHQLVATPLPSTLSLARLLAHMAFVEDHWFHIRSQATTWSSPGPAPTSTPMPIGR